VSGNVVPLWPTVIYRRQLENVDAVNDQLRRDIREHQLTDRSQSLGVRRARKSSPDLLRWDTAETKTLSEHIFTAIEALSAGIDQRLPTSVETYAHAWAVVYQPGGSHSIHAHHDSAWSGVYYVQADPDHQSGGAIDLFDPRTAMRARHAETEATSLRVQPTPGLLLAFPSWLLHRVTPVTGSAQRICIAFNVSFR
jgi:uncharacterized protein (TIGR02466 family)